MCMVFGMRLDDWVAVRESFNLTPADVGRLINSSSRHVCQIENGLIDPPEGYKQMWAEMCEYREECIRKRVEHLPRCRFRGTEKQWIAYKSAVGFVLCRYLAMNSKYGYNPLFSELNQPCDQLRGAE